MILLINTLREHRLGLLTNEELKANILLGIAEGIVEFTVVVFLLKVYL